MQSEKQKRKKKRSVAQVKLLILFKKNKSIAYLAIKSIFILLCLKRYTYSFLSRFFFFLLVSGFFGVVSGTRAMTGRDGVGTICVTDRRKNAWLTARRSQPRGAIFFFYIRFFLLNLFPLVLPRVRASIPNDDKAEERKLEVDNLIFFSNIAVIDTRSMSLNVDGKKRI